MEKQEGLRLLNAIIDNFKNIDHRVVNLGGNSIIIAGKNGKGKSSLIQALMSPVNAKYIPSHAIKDGEESGSIQLEVGGMLHGKEEFYNIDIYFSQAHKSGRLVVTNKDGEKVKNAATVVKTLMGNIGFNVFQFINSGLTPTGGVSEAGVKKQIEILKSLISEDKKKEIFTIETKKKVIYDARTKNNSLLGVLENEFKACPYSPEDIAQNVEAVPFTDEQVGAVKKEMQDISDSVERWNKVNDGVVSRAKELESIKVYQVNELETLKELTKNLVSQKWTQPLSVKYVGELFKVISNMEADIIIQNDNSKIAIALEDAINKGKTWLSSNAKPTVEAVSKKLEDMNSHNSIVKDIQEYAKKHDRILSTKALVSSQSKEMEDLEVKRREIFSSADMPVPGLSFTDDEIYYNGKPFNEDHIPKSHIIGIGIKIAMAMNPNLKTLIIQDGSLLDDEMLKAIIGMADKYGYQLIVEVVDNEHDVPEIKFTEEVITKSK